MLRHKTSHPSAELFLDLNESFATFPYDSYPVLSLAARKTIVRYMCIRWQPLGHGRSLLVHAMPGFPPFFCLVPIFIIVSLKATRLHLRLLPGPSQTHRLLTPGRTR